MKKTDVWVTNKSNLWNALRRFVILREIDWSREGVGHIRRVHFQQNGQRRTTDRPVPCGQPEGITQ